MDWKSRLKNYAFWVSMASVVALIGQATGLYKIPSNYDTVVNSLLYTLVAMGIINNPTTANSGYLDDKK